MDKKHILIVDDEQDIRNLLKFNLDNENYKTILVEDGETAISAARKSNPDLIILDLMLPGIQGLDVCRILKNSDDTSNIPILMLTAKGEEVDIVKGLELGADDYVVKPFSVKVLLARVNNILKRKPKPEKDSVLEFDNLIIHPGKHEVNIEGGEKVDLTFSEFKILFVLASHPNWVYTRNQLIDEIRGEDYPVTDRSIDFQIVGLRKKLKKASKYVQTVRGIGYRFLIDD
ncbi:MAG: DNA-binding response regulator [Candidatus Marinimicrobia bacterium]|jgi:two-component system alkaline phosphatase synthesis response regulator PhoP|nr:DNA-binding response regulator [Candidatus Neomarinimicrobiota bacterium]|tara:strand:+ start:466 stop:1155 length:690 start_codon:yes stop_codon:yes gene_type:complete